MIDFERCFIMLADTLTEQECGIVQKQEERGWGKSVVDRLSRDLAAAFPETKGYSARNLRDMRRFFTEYSNPSIWRQAVAKLPNAPIGQTEWRRPTLRLLYLRITIKFFVHLSGIFLVNWKL